MTTSAPIRIAFSDFWHPPTAEAVRDNSLYRFLARHFPLELSERPDFLIYSCFGRQYRNYNCVRIFYTGENVRPDFAECDYAFSFDYPETERNYRLPLCRLCSEYEALFAPREPERGPAGRRFCCFLNSNPNARERIELFDKLSAYRHVDSGGKVKNNLGYLVPDKMAFLRQYKFSIAFENSQHPGYTTEKLLQALVAGTIPLYWGNPRVAEDFNAQAFINCHDYASLDDVVAAVRAIDQNDDLYRSYLTAPFFPGGVENPALSEAAIVARFAQIFSSRKAYVSTLVKSAQFVYHKAAQYRRSAWGRVGAILGNKR